LPKQRKCYRLNAFSVHCAFATNCLGPGPRLYGSTARCLARSRAASGHSSRGRTTYGTRRLSPKPLAVPPARAPLLARSSSTRCTRRDEPAPVQSNIPGYTPSRGPPRRRAPTPTRHASVAVACVTGRGCGAKVGRATSSAVLQLPDETTHACMHATPCGH